MSRIRNFLALVVGLVLVVGCAQQREIPYDRQTAQVRTIGLLTPAVPEETTLFLNNSPGAMFGIIGALVDAGIQTGRQDTFNEHLRQQNYSAASIFTKALIEQLRKDGYAVREIAIGRTPHQPVRTLPAVDPADPVDAYLDVAITGQGYVANGMATPYRPVVSGRARLVQAGTNAVLMDVPVSAQPEALRAAEYPDYATLIAQVPAAARGLEVVLSDAGRSVAREMQ